MYKDGDKVNLTKGDKEKTDALADFFGFVFTCEDRTEQMPDIEGYENIDTLEDVIFSEKDVIQKLDNLKIGKSP